MSRVVHFLVASPSPSNIRLLGQLSTLGMSIVVALVLGFGGGMALDNWLGTAPWLRFLGFFLGLAAGVLNVYRVMREANALTTRPTSSLTPPPANREE